MMRVLLFPVDHVGDLKRVRVERISPGHITTDGIVIEALWSQGGQELFEWFTRMETLIMTVITDSAAITHQFTVFHVSVSGNRGQTVEALLHPRRPDYIRR